MINLLPTDLKEQIRFAKLNRLTLRYLELVIVVIVILGVIFVGSLFYLNAQSAQVAKDVASKQASIAKTTAFQKQAKDASDRLAAIKSIQASQTRYSVLLDDLAKVLPTGVSMDAIVLTGNDKAPVKLTVTGNTYDSILAFRNSLITSPRISGADLESIGQSGSLFTASVVIGFKPGQAR
jgi:Tfp pilus assembly protein PilN